MIMILTIIFITNCWNTVSSPLVQKSNVILEKLFKNRYMAEDAVYSIWPELHEAPTVDLTYICYKYAMLLLGAQRVRFNAGMSASYRDQYTLSGSTEVVEVDTLKCLISHLDENGTEIKSTSLYLTDGDEEDSAFAFSLNEMNSIILTHKLINIWDKNMFQISI